MIWYSKRHWVIFLVNIFSCLTMHKLGSKHLSTLLLPISASVTLKQHYWLASSLICSSKVLFSPAGLYPPKDVIVNTYPVHSSASSYLPHMKRFQTHILFFFFSFSHKSNTNLFLSQGTIRMKYLFRCIPVEPVITAVTLKCFFISYKWFMAFCSKLLSTEPR